jgi:hypothetical protein
VVQVPEQRVGERIAGDHVVGGRGDDRGRGWHPVQQLGDVRANRPRHGARRRRRRRATGGGPGTGQRVISDQLATVRRYDRAGAAQMLNIKETWLERWVSARCIAHQRKGDPNGKPAARGVVHAGGRPQDRRDAAGLMESPQAG